MQHAGPQHFPLAAGLTARIKALMSFPSTWVFTGQREHFIGHVEAVGGCRLGQHAAWVRLCQEQPPLSPDSPMMN
jgi:hypothetical protein